MPPGPAKAVNKAADDPADGSDPDAHPPPARVTVGGGPTYAIDKKLGKGGFGQVRGEGGSHAELEVWAYASPMAAWGDVGWGILASGFSSRIPPPRSMEPECEGNDSSNRPPSPISYLGLLSLPPL